MSFVYKIFTIVLGSLIIGIGVDFFLVPFRILDGGIMGIALITQYLYGTKVGLSVILLSMPIYIYTWFTYRSFFYNSILGMLLTAFSLDLLYPYQFHFTYYIRLSPYTSSIIGGILVGIGIGFMLRNGTSIGGADMLAQIIASLSKINVGIIIFCFDALVIITGGILISAETFFLSLITIFFVGLLTSITTFGSSLSN